MIMIRVVLGVEVWRVVRGQKREEKRDQCVLPSFVGVGRHLVAQHPALFTLCVIILSWFWFICALIIVINWFFHNQICFVESCLI